MTPRERVIVALDVPSEAAASRLVERLAGQVGMFKVGSRLFTAAGPAFVRALVSRGEKVFLDLKYHDIPNTVAEAVTEAGGLGARFIDVHALGGRSMIRAAAAALSRAGGGAGATKLLAVTILTSHDEGSLEELGLRPPLRESVRRLALLAQGAGAHGVVASPHEVGLIREACGREFLVVTPGIRPAGEDVGGQARAATPASAIRAGADYVVVGRPITGAADPAAAAAAIVREMESAAS
jgi:orotidine-5'-phosphate decarboxylase